MADLKDQIQLLSPPGLIALYVLDCTGIGGSVSRFHSGTNELKNPVTWQGNVYAYVPLEANGFEMSGQGTLPRPKIRVGDQSGAIGVLVRSLADLVGAKVTRKRTMTKYLDAVNFTGGVNASADPNAGFPDDIWFIERKVKEVPLVSFEFELVSASDVYGIMLPRRQVIQNVCGWRYRSAECSYAGGAVAKEDDTATGDINLDECGKRLASCKLRFGTYNPLPYGGFPGAGLTRP